jgi:hypothetical protein
MGTRTASILAASLEQLRPAVEVSRSRCVERRAVRIQPLGFADAGSTPRWWLGQLATADLTVPILVERASGDLPISSGRS